MGKEYKLVYSVDMLPSCCGMSLVHGLDCSGVAFSTESDQVEVLSAFSKFLTRDKKGLERERYYTFSEQQRQSELDPVNIRRSKLIVADAVGGERGESTPSLWKMCVTNSEWEQVGTPVKNSNSTNHVVLFEFNKHPEVY